MVKLYATLIEKGLKTIEDVPLRIRAEVEQELERRQRENV